MAHRTITPFFFFGLAYLSQVLGQAGNPADDSLDDARFPILRGANFTFQPSAGVRCHWAVAQYQGSGKEFFVLDGKPACPGLAENSTTLVLRFGGNVVPGNASLTVQCDEPAVWHFIISREQPVGFGRTTLTSVCDIDGVNGLSSGWRSPTVASGFPMVSASAGRLRPTSSVGYPGNWSFTPTNSMPPWLTGLSSTSVHSITSTGNSDETGSMLSTDTMLAPGATTGLLPSTDQGSSESLMGIGSTLSSNRGGSTSSMLTSTRQTGSLSGLQDQTTKVGSVTPMEQSATHDPSATADPGYGTSSTKTSQAEGIIPTDSDQGSQDTKTTATAPSPCTCTC